MLHRRNIYINMYISEQPYNRPVQVTCQAQSIRGLLLQKDASPKMIALQGSCLMVLGAVLDAGFTRLGPPSTDLPSYVAIAYSCLTSLPPAPAPEEELPNGWNQVESALEAVAHTNGLMLDRETATDGDCGLDALLRNIQRLSRLNKHAQDVLSVLQCKGRKAALTALRLKLLIWLRDHRNEEILPAVSIEDWVAMEPGMDSFAQYMTAMRQAGCWIDTPMLHAASALLGIQVVCLVGSSDPQLIVAPSVVASTEVETAIIANVGNYHFYALYPSPPMSHDVTTATVDEDMLLVATELDTEAWSQWPSSEEVFLPNPIEDPRKVQHYLTYVLNLRPGTHLVETARHHLLCCRWSSMLKVKLLRNTGFPVMVQSWMLHHGDQQLRCGSGSSTSKLRV